MMKLIDMKRTAAELKSKNEPSYIGSREPYPYGLSLSLDADMLKKLGITDLPDAGAEYHIKAIGKVTSVSQNASEKDKSSNVSLQITSLAVSSEGCDDNESKESAGVYKPSTGMRYK